MKLFSTGLYAAKKSVVLLSTGLEPMTLALSEPRATNCAKRANVFCGANGDHS